MWLCHCIAIMDGKSSWQRARGKNFENFMINYTNFFSLGLGFSFFVIRINFHPSPHQLKWLNLLFATDLVCSIRTPSFYLMNRKIYGQWKRQSLRPLNENE